MIDKLKAVETFVQRVEQLSRLPFITDEEMEELFGEEVIAAISRLDRLNREKQLCTACQKHCCELARCELYALSFGRCPVHDLRPVLCRLHFCFRFQGEGNPLVDELSDIFFECVLAADRAGNPRARLFDSPPLVLHCPELVAAVEPRVKAVREGTANPDKVAAFVRSNVEKYRL